uniref:Glycosyltransferase n=1 Tax=Hordeum vulgare subsp. vulgare TaxID=112509 RepID=A0A8I6YJ58_HORVV
MGGGGRTGTGEIASSRDECRCRAILSNNVPFHPIRRKDVAQELLAPEELQDKIGNRGRIVSWAPQQEVLKHPSVVAFLTHCGWNSTTESMSVSVPMICRPLISDQMGTSRYVCDVWKVGVKVEVKKQLKRGNVQAAITRLMEGKEGEEVRERMKDLRHAVKKCTNEGGTSDVALQHLVGFSA